MGIVSKATVASYFVSGARPTEDNFADFIDSTIFHPVSSNGTPIFGFIQTTGTAASTTYASAGAFPVTIAASGATSATLSQRFGDTVNVKRDFGAAGDGSADDTAALQRAHDEGLSSTGGRLYIPAGVYLVNSAALNISKPCEIFGDAQGTSELRSNSASGHVISINTATQIAVHLHDFTIGRTGAVVKDAGTAGIYVNENAGAGSVNAKIIERVRVLNMYDAIRFDDAYRPVVRDCRLLNFLNAGVVCDQLGNRDQPSGLIEGNLMWDIAGTAGARAGVLVHKGNGWTICKNRILGHHDYGVEFDFDSTTGNTGHLFIFENLMDAFETYGVYVHQSAASEATAATFSAVGIRGNHFGCTTAGVQKAIYVPADATHTWNGVNVVGNHVNNNQVNDSIIEVADGVVNISDNIIYNFGGKAGGIETGGSVTGNVSNNVFLGTTLTTAQKYVSIASGTAVTDKSTEYNAAVATTSGTSVTITSVIPSWVTEVEVFLSAVSTNTDNQGLIFLMNGETTGYLSTASFLISSATVGVGTSTAAIITTDADSRQDNTTQTSGKIRFQRTTATGNQWSIDGRINLGAIAGHSVLSSIKSTSSAWTTLSITTPGGTATFDNGSITIRWK